MAIIDQSRFDDQHTSWVSAAEAASILEVKRATLYAYVSRGLVTARGQRRARVYKREDLERLAARRDARRGHRAVASAALRWGEPVLDSEISEITGAALRYRNVDAIELADDRRFEQVAELLWSSGESPPWTRLAVHRRSRRPQATADQPLLGMRAVPSLLAIADPDRMGASRSAELVRARSMISALADRIDRDSRAISIAERLVAANQRRRAAAIDALNCALILVADHGLNVSTFAARVAASAGADLYAGVSAALAAFSGPRHGGSCEELEALLPACGSDQAARKLVAERGRLGLALPGFGHPLYPRGDVRAPPLLKHARALGKQGRLARLERLIAAAARSDREPATVDLGVVAISAALGWPPGHATALFAIGRAAGWVAHILEQREAGYMLRPRARFSANG